MKDKDLPSGFPIRNAVRAEQKSSGAPDRSRLAETLVKSPQWKENVLSNIEKQRSASSTDGDDSGTDRLKNSLLDLIERHWLELVTRAAGRAPSASLFETDNAVANDDDIAAQIAEEQAAELQRRESEVQRLQQLVAALEAENARLLARFEEESMLRKTELLELRQAFAQFEQESDRLLGELDRENAALRVENSA